MRISSTKDDLAGVRPTTGYRAWITKKASRAGRFLNACNQISDDSF